MSSKPQSASSRRGDGAAQSEFGGDDTLSQGSDAVELLTKGVIRRGLSDIQRSSDKKNFAFTRLDLTGQGIKNLEGDLATYPEVRYLNVSNNEILDLAPLSVLPSLLSVNASSNHLHHLDSFFGSSQPSLQLLQLDHNEIEYVFASTGGDAGGKRASRASLSQTFPSLFGMTLSNNKLTSLLRAEDSLADFAPHQRLAILDLSFNQLTSLEGLSLLPALRVLNLASNAIERLEGIQSLTHLEKLNVSENRLQSLFVELGRLADLPALESLIITQGNAAFVEELEAAAVAAAEKHPEGLQLPVDMPSEILLRLPRLALLDGRKVTSAQRRTADALKKDRAADAERRALEEEEARKALAEEEAAEAKRRKEEEEEEEKEKAEDEEEEKEKNSEDEHEDDEDEKERDAEAEDADAHDGDQDQPAEDGDGEGDLDGGEEPFDGDADGGEEAGDDADPEPADDDAPEDDAEPEEDEEEED